MELEICEHIPRKTKTNLHHNYSFASRVANYQHSPLRSHAIALVLNVLLRGEPTQTQLAAINRKIQRFNHTFSFDSIRSK